ncbi:glycosyltransferase involved in cell wall biosynthesis [Rhizomicrobium palustre]|uniref:Glycosyltransferase involved in cell wall biosynthesis n=1 Tax=Rhizomicrobium palustre TaxID=189966 RepID=A0A846MV91_9PROT|nr:glycosyltransferase family 2 protein [Rhizomicrobium palustre]NIK86927.1 glycosyltransferase involved in cell wall biosynthesis [Rhizomicrobium palustre]
MKKLIIQIPCLNEAETLPQTLADLPREVDGFDRVEFLVIDDGSTDQTVAVARAQGVDHILSLGHRHGLATAFSEGIMHCLRHGADVIINTDGDNQYQGGCVATLAAPILANQADIVIGARPISDIEHFSLPKKILQNFGSWIVRIISHAEVPDAPSGFRAFSREAAIQLKVFGSYTYTLETIIQSGLRNIRIVSVPIQVNPKTRPSRLIGSTASYILRSTITILRVFAIYAPLRFFMLLAATAFVPAVAIWLRFGMEYLNGGGHGHVQSLILSSVLFGLSGVLALAGIVGDIMSANRRLLEDVRVMLIRRELDSTHTSREDEPELHVVKKWPEHRGDITSARY